MKGVKSMSIETMETTANLNLSMAIHDYAKKMNITEAESRNVFLSSEIIDALYDYENGLWGEGPDRLIEWITE